MKSFSKNPSFGVDFKLQVPPLMYSYKINTHNISGVRNQVNNPDLLVVMNNYVCMYVYHIYFVLFKFKDRKLPQYNRHCIDILNVIPRFKPQVRHLQQKKYFFLRLPASIRLKVNKNAMKKFCKNLSFGADFKLQGTSRINLTHTT